MLHSLHIKNYALIENLSVEFKKGFNAITGETGAGKSIIIGALGLLLGERASTEAVRKGANKSVVEGIFEAEGNNKLTKFLQKNDIDIESELIVRREISSKGSSRSFLNDTPVNLTTLKEAGNLLVDLHGQHDHQSLLRLETHIMFLDECGDYENLLQDFKKNKNQFNLLNDKLNSYLKKEASLKEKKELYSFQIKEIDEVSPFAGEEDELENKLIKLENSEKLTELTSAIYSNLYDDENSSYIHLNKIKSKLYDLVAIDKSFNEKINDFESVLAVIEDIASDTRKYQNNIESNPEELESIRERLGSLNLLKKKYGGSISAILEHREKIGQEYELAENFTENINAVKLEIEKSRSELASIGQKLTSKRKKLAFFVENEIVEKLKDLGIENGQFNVQILPIIPENGSNNFVEIDKTKIGIDNSGLDNVEFQISTNKGEDPKSLIKVASGGEISRIMLALKSVLAKNEKLPLLIFDEIDTGVSGRIAQKVGTAMKKLADHHQIIAITHLPQIAGLAEQHYIVQKKEIGDRVVSEITQLQDEERIVEIAKLLSGESVTDSSLESARELINS